MEQIAINYRLLLEELRGHRVFESGWRLQIAEATCFPRDRKSKSSQLPDTVVRKQGRHHIYKSRRQYFHTLIKHFHNGIQNVVQTAYIARSGFIMNSLHLVHKGNSYRQIISIRPHVSPAILHGLILMLFNDVVSIAASEVERCIWILFLLRPWKIWNICEDNR
jgi:hypothetical protein